MKKALCRVKKWSDSKRFLFSSLTYITVAAIILTWFLEYRYYINDFAKTWSFVFGSPLVFLFNAFLIWLILLAIWGVCGRSILTSAIGFVAISILSYIHIAKHNSRGYPLLPEDFQLAGETSTLTKFIDVWSIIRLVIVIIIVCALLAYFSHCYGRRLNLRHKQSKGKHLLLRHLAPIRVLVIAIAVASFMSSTEFVRHNEGTRYEDIFLGTHFTAWNQNRNYDDNGFVLGFLYNFQKLELDAPEGYGEERIANIKKQYETIAKSENKKRFSPSDEDVSLVIVLNESFFDPTVEFQGKKFSDYYEISGGDVLPELHKLKKRAATGYMYSLDYGGGTANIEFEALTSLTNFWTNTVPYTALIPKAGTVPSIGSFLKEQKYETLAIHPFNGGMYKRNIALKNEGFDSFTTEIEMDYTEHEGDSEYINDRSAYKQTIDALKKSNNNQAIALITMQNHTPYNESTYTEHDFTVLNDDIGDWQKSRIETYLQTLHESDKYLGEFINDLDNLDKKVVVLFFGDHSAGVFNKTNDSSDKEVRDLSRITPYFIYTNYESGIESDMLPTTTPNCIVNTMLDKLKWKKTAIHYLADEACSQEPILTSTYLEGKDFELTEMLQNYQLVTYDILGGERYWIKNK